MVFLYLHFGKIKQPTWAVVFLPNTALPSIKADTEVRPGKSLLAVEVAGDIKGFLILQIQNQRV